MTVTVFSPAVHVAALPFETVVLPFLMTIVASPSSAAAVILSDAALVSAVYSVMLEAKLGDSGSVPIVSAERFAQLEPETEHSEAT